MEAHFIEIHQVSGEKKVRYFFNRVVYLFVYQTVYLLVNFSRRNLVNLEATGDPAWDGISCHSSYISQRLNACKDEHIVAETTNAEESGK